MNRDEAMSRCWAEIDLDVLCGNYLRARERVGEGVRVICVLKGNAYGMGAETVCRALAACGADFFAVASGDEAEALLAACPGAEVLVLGLVGEAQAERLIRLGCVLTLFSGDHGRRLVRAAEAAGRPARVHIKAETGLYRLGFTVGGVSSELPPLLASGLLSVEGCFTHLALHDRESDGLQFARLDAFAAALAKLGVRPGCVHALDSIGMVRYPGRFMDAVRIGAWLYGVTPSRFDEPGQCLPVARFMARVAQLHDVPAGERIGYDDEHRLPRDSRIATLSAGYVDGFPRLNSTGAVLIRGCRAPVVGLVCMDQMMVDVTDIPGVQPGDAAELLGDGIGLNEYAAQAGLNRNEALCRIGRRVTRVYRLRGKEWYENGMHG